VILDTIDSYAVTAFLVLLVVDIVVRSRGFARPYAPSDSLCSVTMGLFYAGSGTVIRATVLLAFGALHVRSPLHLGFDGGPVVWVAAFVGVDFAFYWFHRTLHEVRLGWAAHVNHHSSTHYNYATGLRQSVVEPFIEPLFMAPLVLIGFDPVLVLAALALNFVYQFWPHTEFIKGLDAMGTVFVTPSHHRVHHARNVEYLDKNYGGTFIVWDKLFGTFEPEREAPDYGITHNLTTHNPFRATFHEWAAIGRDLARAGSLSECAGYLLRPPGWTPDGSGQTSRERQRRYRAENASG
jgi:sterol desaturase/sphingolipid hydroxylase (fatty acid hydroxylase superfamily)